MITRLLRQPFFKTTIKEKTKCLGIDISFAINILLIPNPKLYFYFHRKEFRRMKNNFFTLFWIFFFPPLKYPPPRNKKIKFSFIDIFRKLLKKPHMKHTYSLNEEKKLWPYIFFNSLFFVFFKNHEWIKQNTLPNLLISSYICLKKNCHPDQINLKLNLLLLFITPLIDVTRD